MLQPLLFFIKLQKENYIALSFLESYLFFGIDPMDPEVGQNHFWNLKILNIRLEQFFEQKNWGRRKTPAPYQMEDFFSISHLVSVYRSWAFP
jgi:hypothetical protein